MKTTIKKDTKKIVESKGNFDKPSKGSVKNLKEIEQIYSKNLELKKQLDKEKNILKKARENFNLDIEQKYKEIEQYKKDMNTIIEKSKTSLSQEYEELYKNQDKFDLQKKSFNEKFKQRIIDFNLKQQKQKALMITKKNELDAFETRLNEKREKNELDIKKFNSEKEIFQSNLVRFRSIIKKLGKETNKVDKNN